MAGIRKALKGSDLLLLKELWRRGEGCNGSYVSDDDIADAALCQTIVKLKALFADGAVALLITCGQRRKHNTVFKGSFSYFDWF